MSKTEGIIVELEYEMIERMRTSETRTLWKTGLSSKEEAACHALALRGVFTEGSMAFAVKELPPPRKWKVRTTIDVRIEVEAPTSGKAIVAASALVMDKFDGHEVIDVDKGKPKESKER